MATQRTRNETVSNYTPNPRPGSGAISRVKRFTITYNSNRESGQIVKRESPLTMYLEELLTCRGGNSVDVSNWSAAYYTQGWVPSSSQCYARAYGSFKKQAAMPSAEVLLNVVEGRKSLEMISARAFQLRNFAQALRRGQLKHAFEYMTLNPDSSLLAMKNGRRRDSRFVSGKERQASMDDARRWRQLLKDISSVVLEYRYGWSPLMQDIKGALDVLSQPIPDKAIRSSRSRSFSETYGSGVKPTQISERVTIKGRIRVSNPNLDLANRLGLINPASVAWEAVPFSFIVDWFLPVGNFLGSFTDFMGIELVDASITGKRTWYQAEEGGYSYLRATGTDFYWDPKRMSGRGVKMVRQVGVGSLPRPPLTLGSGLSPGRAVNAVALLLQALNPRKGGQIRGE